MGIILLFFVMLLLGVGFVFFHFKPRTDNQDSVKVFNLAIIALIFMIVTPWAIQFRAAAFEQGLDKAYLPMMLGGVLMISSGILFIAFLLRNFWIFREARQDGRGLFK